MSAKIGIQRDYYGKLIGCGFGFSGINNIIDSTNLDIDKGRVADAINVDFDNTNSVNRRLGFTAVTGTSGFHSGWNNDNKTCAYMVANSWIYEWDADDDLPTPLVQLSNNNPCEFCQVNNVVVYSNGTDFGVLGGSNQQTHTYSPEFKSSTLGGRCLEFYNGRLYFARENSLHCTDTFDVEHVDVRFNRVATFPHAITMCKRVEDGLWIGTEKYVYFLKGDDIREGGFEQIIVAKSGVVYGTACKTNAEYIPEAQATNNVVIFLSTAGICSGSSGGKYVNHSFNEVTFDTGNAGCATILNKNGVSLYITNFNIDAGEEYNPYRSNIYTEVNTL